MSVKIMSLVWERAPYTAGSLIVLLALADWANDEGVCWPAINRLAQKARLERRSTQYIIRQLKSDEMIRIEEGGGRSKRHRFFINVQKLRLLPEINGASDDAETVQSEAERVQFTTQTVQPIAPDPLEEPLDDPSVEPPESRARSKPKGVAGLSEEEFLLRLEATEAYAGIDIRRLKAKMNTWCEVNGKRPTRRRLVNWLNREDRPMENGNGTNTQDNQLRRPSAAERNGSQLMRNLAVVQNLRREGRGDSD